MMMIFHLPALLLFFSGDAYHRDIDMPFLHWLAVFSFGNLNVHQYMVCSETSNKLEFNCDRKGYKMQSIQSFGLSEDNLCHG